MSKSFQWSRSSLCKNLISHGNEEECEGQPKVILPVVNIPDQDDLSPTVSNSRAIGTPARKANHAFFGQQGPHDRFTFTFNLNPSTTPTHIFLSTSARTRRHVHTAPALNSLPWKGYSP